MSGVKMEEGNLGHRPGIRAATSRCHQWTADDLAEMVSVMKQMGVEVEKHHHGRPHNTNSAFFDSLVKCADNMQIYN